MKVEVVYVAYDGNRFDSPVECKEYENRALSLMNELKSHTIFLDAMKHPILCSATAIENIMAWFYMAYAECLYVNINVELSDDLINFIDGDLGMIFPPNKVGLYKYNYNEDEWVSVD